MNQLLYGVFSSNTCGCRVWLLRIATSSLPSGDERWIRTVLKDPHPVVTQKMSERAEWTPRTTEKTPRNLRRDMSYERLMELDILSIVGDHEGLKQRLPTPFPLALLLFCPCRPPPVRWGRITEN